MVFNVHKEHTDSLDLKEVANDFVSGWPLYPFFWYLFVGPVTIANIKIT